MTGEHDDPINSWLKAIAELPDAKSLVKLLRGGTQMPLGIQDLLAELLDPDTPDFMGGKLIYKETSGVEKVVGRTVQDEETGKITVVGSKLQVVADYCKLMNKGKSSQEAAVRAGAIHGISDRTVYAYLDDLRRLGARLRGK